jgi:hypothetical protein
MRNGKRDTGAVWEWFGPGGDGGRGRQYCAATSFVRHLRLALRTTVCSRMVVIQTRERAVTWMGEVGSRGHCPSTPNFARRYSLALEREVLPRICLFRTGIWDQATGGAWLTRRSKYQIWENGTSGESVSVPWQSSLRTDHILQVSWRHADDVAIRRPSQEAERRPPRLRVG